MSGNRSRLAAAALGLGLGISALAPALAAGGFGQIVDVGDTDRIVADDLPVMLDDVEGGVAGVPGLLGGLLNGGGLLGSLLGAAEELRDAPAVGGGDVGEGSFVGRGLVGGDDGVAAPGLLGGLLHVGSLNDVLGGLL